MTSTFEHLNLRAGPSADDAKIGEIPEGCSVVGDSELPEERWWLHVRTADGLEGWAASDFLDWAD